MILVFVVRVRYFFSGDNENMNYKFIPRRKKALLLLS